ncbi:hypothetical protein D3273_22845 [Lichenibacterium minor]|uniref:Uncharacterized protein n=1 Tax=Lichenibacterium minor TaxID=2316528 RepID=A0A4Q2TZS6_9HYPH|nr:hypothetical protein [Lichenibacterium minor]RYC29653.1 hypothetical protein D3273_22845 [Lichenibacterium minor]
MVPHAETHGPLDTRPIAPDDIGEARERIAGLLRNVKATDGHRAAVTAALAAIASAVDVLIELGAETAALGALRAVAGPLEERAACRAAGEHGETRH